MRAAASLLLGLVLTAVACVEKAPPRVFVHPDYAARRPATMALDVQGPESVREAVAEAVYQALLAMDYTVQVPGEPPAPGMGLARVVINADTPKISAVLSIFNSREDRVFRSDGTEKTPKELAERLVRSLPSKSAGPGSD